MNSFDLKSIELEISSLCNLACPLCHRTKNEGRYELTNISFDDIKRIFPKKLFIKNRRFLLCGALGEPVINKDCYKIVKYLIDNDAFVEINSNASLQTSKFWYDLGKLSSDTNNVNVWFCVDGYAETNHVYRINSNFDIIIKNMINYMEGGKQGKQKFAKATWMYNVFDYNLHELELAKNHSEKLGMKFATRKGVGNSWGFTKKVRVKKGVTESRSYISSGEFQHKNASTVKMIERIVRNEPTQRLIEDASKTIKCKFVHEKEVYIASDQTLWPCCFLWTYRFKNNEVKNKLNYGENWNSLKFKSMDEILSNEWFDGVLEKSWDPLHPKHLGICLITCSFNQASMNEITFNEKNNDSTI